MTNEAMRNVGASHIKTIEFAVDLAGVAVGTHNLTGESVPVGSLIVGAYAKNPADDLASTGSATLAVGVGSSTTVLSAQALADLKGESIGAIDTTLATASTAVANYTVGTEVFSAGKVIVGILYV